MYTQLQSSMENTKTKEEEIELQTVFSFFPVAPPTFENIPDYPNENCEIGIHAKILEFRI